MSITFGSVGDIIAAVQVACKLAEVLNDQRGAKKEFAELITDLRLFSRYLTQLLSFWQSRSQCLQLDNLFDILEPVILDTRGEIDTCLERIITKYGRNLLGNERRSPKDVAKMLKWHVAERDGIARLQEKLRRSKDVILMVQGQANLIAEESNREMVDERLNALMEAENAAHRTLDKRLQSLEDKFDRQSEMLAHIYKKIGSVSSAIVPIANMALLDIPSMLSSIYFEIIAQRAILKTINPYAQNSAIFEDALGWSFQIPLELIASWDVVHSILIDRFEHRPGQGLVKSKQYIMRDGDNGSDIKQDRPLTLAIRPGQKINMSMVFFDDYQEMQVCPRCKLTTLSANETDFTCRNSTCGTQIQRIEELFNPSPQTVTSLISDSSPPTSDLPEIDESLFTTDSFPPNRQSSNSSSYSPEIFKRTRYISRWETRLSSRKGIRYKTGPNYWWDMRQTIEVHAMIASINSKLASDPGSSWSFGQTTGTWDVRLFYFLFFVGRSIEESRPVIIILSKSKAVRESAWRVTKELEWIKGHDSMMLVTSGSEFFHEDMKIWWEEYQKMGEAIRPLE